jgi:CheY-like chemotaxis protein
MWPLLAESGPAALTLLESMVDPVPLILTDVHMPDMDGFELIKHVKIHSQIPTVIMLTSGSYPGDIARSRELGADAYLIKPVRRSELMETIVRILAQHPPASIPLVSWRDSVRGLAKQLGPERTSPVRVLVAEDNIINQRYALEVLEKQGYSVTVVSNGREALLTLERETFDLVLMDVQMPEMDGFEATSSIRARERFTGKRIPIIAMTAHAMGGDRDKCLASGMDAYVPKPIRSAELFETISSLTSNRRHTVPQGPDMAALTKSDDYLH